LPQRVEPQHRNKKPFAETVTQSCAKKRGKKEKT
jgi:hypothetical protein